MAAPKIEFPEPNYPVTVISEMGTEDAVLDIIHQHVESFRREQVVCKQSAQGNYQSIKMDLMIDSAQQLKALFTALQVCKGVRFVL